MTPGFMTGSCLPAACLLLALGLQQTASAGELEVEEVRPATPPVEVENRFAVGALYGGQWYGDGLERGTSGALQISYRAYVDTPEEGRWLFELGFEHARSGRRPEVDDDGSRARLTSTGVYYRFNRLIGPRLFVGGRLGMSRVRGTDAKRDLDAVVGVQTGLRLTDWLDFTMELVAASPSTSGPSAQPADLRAGLVISF